MKYRQDKYGRKLSILGFGCMRFPQKAGKTDLAAVDRMIRLAVRGGVNYFDTAYVYQGSEAALGEVLERRNLRDQVYIASKLPHYLVRNPGDMEKIFSAELKRLRTDHIDYYLMHMLTDVATWERLKGLGIVEWLEEKKKSGAIGQVGFSYHGNSDMFCQLVDAYDWEFCQIQYNYMDEHSQAGRRGLQYAHSKGLPVIIMEPLRGGKLVNNLPASAKKIFEEHPSHYTPAQWALRWLWNQPEVTVVLSGMNSLEMVRDNVITAAHSHVGDLGESEENMLRTVANAINEKMKVPCTGCAYCMPCPQHVDIPGTFAAYNRRYSEGKISAMKDYMMCTAMRRDATSASNCIGCGKCEKHCPQHISIREELKKASRELEGPIYKGARFFISKFKIY